MSKLGRPLKYGEKLVVATVKVPGSRKEEIQKELPILVEQYIEGITSISIDTEILKKMIIPFTNAGIKVDLETNEIERIKELFGEVKKDAWIRFWKFNSRKT